jgi:hypothetical protein
MNRARDQARALKLAATGDAAGDGLQPGDSLKQIGCVHGCTPAASSATVLGRSWLGQTARRKNCVLLLPSGTPETERVWA